MKVRRIDTTSKNPTQTTISPNWFVVYPCVCGSGWVQFWRKANKVVVCTDPPRLHQFSSASNAKLKWIGNPQNWIYRNRSFWQMCHIWKQNISSTRTTRSEEIMLYWKNMICQSSYNIWVSFPRTGNMAVLCQHPCFSPIEPFLGKDSSQFERPNL